MNLFLIVNRLSSDAHPSTLANARRRRSRPNRFIAHVERLESRCLLSASPVAFAANLLQSIKFLPQYRLSTQNGATPQGSTSPVGLTPSQIRHAYGIDQVFFDGGIVGDGTGQTIAIIDAYHTPTIQNDLHQFDLAFGLTDPPSFKQVAQDGSTNFPPVDPIGAGTANNNWELETALDVEWAHAIAPGANILLVEANSNNFSDLMQTAANYARNQPGVVAVSMSFSGDEFSGETSYDTSFTTPAGHGGVTFLAATGDNGQPSGYPAYSPNVIGVGGTTLSTDSDGNYLSETGWTGSGGGVSTVESQPSYQSALVTQSTTNRANPDVAFDANPGSGVAVYDSYNSPGAPWIRVGGTSFSTPAWAGLIAIADQGRSLLGLSSLDGRSETLPLLYQLPAADFHDITMGNNGFAANVGYDLVTGLGSPNADRVIGGLIGSTISGTVFFDANSNGVQDNSESGLAGWTVFDDVNNDGILTPAVQTTVASANVPLAIPDRQTITSTITVTGFTGTISDLNVNLTIHHTSDDDLVITLISPTGTQITLANRNGGSSNNFISTVFDDQASTAISTGSAPFTGSFRPIGSLATLNGIDPNGVWKLQVADVQRRDSGTLDSWSLQITTGADVGTTSDGSGHYRFVGVSPGVHRLREIPQTDFTSTAPASGVYNITVAVGASFKDKNFGNFQPPPSPPPQTTIGTGDFDRDGKLTDADVPAMFAALTDLSVYQSTNSLSDTALLAIGDLNGDGQITNVDIQGLLDVVALADSQAASGGGTTTAVVVNAVAASQSEPMSDPVIASAPPASTAELPNSTKAPTDLTFQTFLLSAFSNREDAVVPVVSHSMLLSGNDEQSDRSDLSPLVRLSAVDQALRGTSAFRDRHVHWLSDSNADSIVDDLTGTSDCSLTRQLLGTQSL